MLTTRDVRVYCTIVHARERNAYVIAVAVAWQNRLSETKTSQNKALWNFSQAIFQPNILLLRLQSILL
jgi:hypothetical protein